MKTIEPSAQDDRMLIQRLGKKARNILSESLSGIKDVALVDFPNHINIGDNAIWLGERALLSKLNVKIHYISDIHTHSQETLKRKVLQYPILIHGGGNMGDIWPEHEKFRQSIVKTFSSNKIIQLPQTVDYINEQSLDSAKKIYDGHSDFTILVRDEKSLQFCQKEFRAKSILCPDMAFCIDVDQKVNRPSIDVLLLLRKDIETVNPNHSINFNMTMERTDWADGFETRLSKMVWYFINQIKKHPVKLAFLARLLSHSFDRLAEERFQFGCRILNKGKIVITDRLHGHILCVLLGKPHILLDNKYGKIRRFYEAFTYSVSNVRVALNLEDALSQAYRYISTDSFLD